MIKNINKVSGCLLILPLKIHKLSFHTTVLWRSWLSGRGLGWWASLRPHVSTLSRVKGTISCVWGPIAHLGVLVPTLGSIKSVWGEWVCARRVSPCVVYVCMRVGMLVCVCVGLFVYVYVLGQVLDPISLLEHLRLPHVRGLFLPTTLAGSPTCPVHW